MNSSVFFNPATISDSAFLGFLERAAENMIIGLSGLLVAVLLMIIWRCVFEQESPKE